MFDLFPGVSLTVDGNVLLMLHHEFQNGRCSRVTEFHSVSQKLKIVVTASIHAVVVTTVLVVVQPPSPSYSAVEFNGAIDGIIDIESPAYIEGIETAIQQCGNNL